MASEYVSTHVAKGLLGIGKRRIEQLCQSGTFRSAFKPGGGKQGHWKILRSEIIAHKFNGHAQPFS